MGETLQNPPLIEALCQFIFHRDIFDDDVPWEWNFIDQFHAGIKNEFPDRSEIERPGGGIPLLDGNGQVAEEVVSPRLFQFKNLDDNLIIQAGKNILVVNNLRPYVGWPALRDMIAQMYSLYTGITKRRSVINLGLRYINNLGSPFSGFKISDYFQQASPPGWAPAKHRISSYYQQYGVSLDDPSGVLLQKSGVYPSEGKTSVILDLDFSSSNVDDVKPGDDSLVEWLNGAHNYIDKAFVGTINPRLYQWMKGGEELS
jgi:uncharacterized protein (TIGR04255 family)